jgi:hypothetical protein
MQDFSPSRIGAVARTKIVFMCGHNRPAWLHASETAAEIDGDPATPFFFSACTSICYPQDVEVLIRPNRYAQGRPQSAPTSYGYVVRQQSRAEAALEERTVSREIDSSFFLLCSYGGRTGDLTYGAAQLRAKTACSAANGEPNHRPLGVFNFKLLYCARRQDIRQQ